MASWLYTENPSNSTVMASPRVYKRKTLTLEERIKVISQSEEGLSAAAISKLWGCGKTQIQYIIRDKAAILELWKSGQGQADQQKKSSKITYDKLDDLVWEWFCNARAENMLGKYCHSGMRKGGFLSCL